MALHDKSPRVVIFSPLTCVCVCVCDRSECWHYWKVSFFFNEKGVFFNSELFLLLKEFLYLL